MRTTYQLKDTQCIPSIFAITRYHKKEQVHEKTFSDPKKELKIEARDNKEYKFQAIIDNTIYSQ